MSEPQNRSGQELPETRTTLKGRWRQLRPKLLSRMVFGVARMICWTLRWRVSGLGNVDDAPGGVLLCIWHGRTFLPAHFMRKRGIWAIFSLSNDGELQSRVFRLLGYQIIRGSTGRGGERAAIEAIRALRKGGHLAITPDGPRGPNRVVQGGALLIAKKSGAAMIPIGVSARSKWLVKTWDHYLIPRPFTTAAIRFGEPIWFSRDATEEEMDLVRDKLTDAMNRLEKEAERDLAR